MQVQSRPGVFQPGTRQVGESEVYISERCSPRVCPNQPWLFPTICSIDDMLLLIKTFENCTPLRHHKTNRLRHWDVGNIQIEIQPKWPREIPPNNQHIHFCDLRAFPFEEALRFLGALESWLSVSTFSALVAFTFLCASSS